MLLAEFEVGIKDELSGLTVLERITIDVETDRVAVSEIRL